MKSLKRKMEKLHSKYVFAPVDKAANNVIISVYNLRHILPMGSDTFLVKAGLH